jgi:hydrogenase maturation protease
MAIHVVALGNRAMSDDGAGPLAVDWLQSRCRRPGVFYHNPGEGSPGHYGLLAGTDHIWVVDSLRSGHPPGTVVRLRASALDLCAAAFSLHDIHLLHLAQRFFPHRLRDMRIYGIEPADLTHGLHLSPPVARGLPLLARRVARDLFLFTRPGAHD